MIRTHVQVYVSELLIRGFYFWIPVHAFSWKCIWCPADYISIIILQQFIIAINLMNFSLYIALFLLISHQTKNHEIFCNFSYPLQACPGKTFESVKGSPCPSYFIFEINVGKRRIRHRKTFKLNELIFNRF